VNEIVIFLIFAIPILLYVASLKLNPWVICSNCKNKPKKKGWVAHYSHHVCPKCKGTGQQLRFGRHFLFGEPVPPDKR
jgi:DnaJ-class molecular chaperone